jgi:hypothetical protein
MMWGRHKESGVWRAGAPKRKMLWRGHDSLYIAAGRIRIRLMKPWQRCGLCGQWHCQP